MLDEIPPLIHIVVGFISITITHQCEGSTLYLSPERLKEQSYKYDCDLWSCGVVLTELFTGKQPSTIFPYKWNAYCDFNKFVACHVEELRRHSASNCLIDFVVQCLKVNPAERPSYDEILAHQFITGYAQSLTEEQQLSVMQRFLIDWILPFVNVRQ